MVEEGVDHRSARLSAELSARQFSSQLDFGVLRVLFPQASLRKLASEDAQAKGKLKASLRSERAMDLVL
jgi:hypothetical protein